jgi:hypothetical protein
MDSKKLTNEKLDAIRSEFHSSSRLVVARSDEIIQQMTRVDGVLGDLQDPKTLTNEKSGAIRCMKVTTR